MATKRAKCPNCCPDGGAIFHSTTDIDGNKVWHCNNCNHQMPRRLHKRPDESSPLSPAQLKAITRVQQYKLRDDKTEVKQFSVVQLGFTVSVVCEVGRKGDEGTAAAIFCRHRGHFMIGRNGGIRSMSHKMEDNAKAKKYPLIYGWRS